MKYLLTILTFFVFSQAFSQSTIPLRGDTILMYKQGGNANLKLMNATRDSVNGVAINVGGGVMHFKRIRAINDSQFVVGTDTITIAGATGSGGGSVETASRGLNKYVNDIRMGGTLDSIVKVTANGFLTEWNNNTAITTFRAQNSSSGPAMEALGTSGYGINGSSVSGTGVYATSTTGQALNAYVTNTTFAAEIRADDASNSSVAGILHLKRTTTNTAAAGIGLGIDMYLEHSSGTHTDITGRIINKLTTATTASRTSSLEFWILNSTTLARKMEIAGNGEVTLDAYTGGITGTPTKYAAFTSAGKLIQVSIPSVDSMATIINAVGGGIEIVNFQTTETVVVKNLQVNTGTFLGFDSTGTLITFKLDTAGLRDYFNLTGIGGGGGSGSDTANLIFDTIPHATGPTALMQSGDTLRAKAFGDSTLIHWVTNGAGKLVAVLDTGNTFFDGGGSAATGWALIGNTLSADGIIGTLSNHDMHVYTNNVKRAEFTNDGKFLWNLSAPVSANNKVAFGDSVEMKSLRIFSTGTEMFNTGRSAPLTVKSFSALSTDYAMQVTDNSNVTLLRLTNAGTLSGTFGSIASGLLLMGGTTFQVRPTNGTTTTGTLITLTHNNAFSATSGNQNVVAIGGNHNASSGTATMTSLLVQPNMSQTGTASGEILMVNISPLQNGYTDPWWLSMTSQTVSEWPSYKVTQQRITTTDATPTTIRTFKTEASLSGVSSTYKIVCEIFANRTGGASGASGDNAVYVYTGYFERVNGVVTQISEALSLVNEDQAGWNVTSSISSTNILIQVTGAASNNITWHLVRGERFYGGD